MIRINRHNIIVFFLLIIFSVQAQDSLNVMIESYNKKFEQHLFLNDMYLQPSQIAYSGLTEYAMIDVGHSYNENDEIIDFNQGLSKRETIIKVATLKQLRKNEMFYGKAYYVNSKTFGVNWNTTSDVDLLYPYIMSDTIGGDLYSETYYFNSGYSKNIKKWTLGGFFSYRGLLDYRLTDPRPKNTVADLSLEFGTSYNIYKKYNIGIDLGIEKYKQSNTVKFFSELGATPLFHMVGLARDYSRFFGDKREVQYTGGAIKGTLSYVSRDKSGVSLLANYKKSSYRKILQELNNLPMSLTGNQEINISIGYEGKQPNYVWGVKLTTNQAHRKGTENIFGDAVNSEYPQIATLSLFYLDKESISLFAMSEWNIKKNLTFSINHNIQYNVYNDQYLYPKRQLKTNYFFNNTKISTGYYKRKSSYFFALNLYFKNLQNSRYEISGKEDDKRLLSYAENLHKYHTSNFNGFQTDFNWEYETSKKIILALGAHYHYQRYSVEVTQNQFALNIGLIW